MLGILAAPALGFLGLWILYGICRLIMKLQGKEDDIVQTSYNPLTKKYTIVTKHEREKAFEEYARSQKELKEQREAIKKTLKGQRNT
jgi:hypothetical protein